jgi:hypothetical protein
MRPVGVRQSGWSRLFYFKASRNHSICKFGSKTRFDGERVAEPLPGFGLDIFRDPILAGLGDRLEAEDVLPLFEM